jgi:3-hydroxyisobutyrate dehydrogenase-like beta-hydroxyacid dehydrogenase
VTAVPTREPIGFIGLGAMGAPMVRRLLSLGYEVVVCDVNPQALETARAAGARLAASPHDVASRTAVVCTCLPSLDALRQVVLGEEGVSNGKRVGILVDFSTTGSDFARELAQRLSPRGIALLDAPITGGVVTAGNGGLGIMCSGPRAAFERVEHMMRDLASAVVLYLGERSGTAQTLKLLNNLLSASGMATSCEAFILGFKAGLDPWRMLEVINAGDASSSASRNKFPKSVLPRRFDYGARMAITAKDTSLTVAEAESLGVPMWIGQAVRQVWNVAASQGGANNDASSLITYLEPWAGVEVRSAATPAPKLDAVARMEVRALLMVCDARTHAALSRVDEQVGGPLVPDAVTWVVVDAEARADDVCAALPPRKASRPRTVVNLCAMNSRDTAALMQTVTRAGDGYVEVRPIGPLRDIGTPRALYVVAGAAEDCAHAARWLGSLGGRALWVSARPGDAQLMRDLHEAVFATLLAATCEAFVAGAKAGLAPESMARIMGVETGRNAASATIIPEQVATRRFDHGRTIGELERALDGACDAARKLGVTPWVLEKARLLYGLASRLGSPADDASRLITHYERWAGVEVRALAAPPSQ